MIYRTFAALVNGVAAYFSKSTATPAAPTKMEIKTDLHVDAVAKMPDPVVKQADTVSKLVEPAYLKKARTYIGIKEVPGAAANAQIVGFFARAGFPGIKDDETAWCAAFANSCLEETGYSGTKALNARSFLTWGKELKKPYPGALTVLWRGSPDSWEGHVGFYIDETDTHIRLLGGNQGNQVSVALHAKAQLLGYREPVTAMNSRTTGAATMGLVMAGAGSSAILDSQQQILGISGALKEIGVSMPAFQLAAQILGIVAFAIIIYARYADLKEKGR